MPESAKVDIIIILHCKEDKLAAYSDMRLFANAVKEAGGNVVIVEVPIEVAKSNRSPHNFHTFFWKLLQSTSCHREVWSPIRNEILNPRRKVAAPVASDDVWHMPGVVPPPPLVEIEKEEEDDEASEAAASSSGAAAGEDVSIDPEKARGRGV